MTTSYRTKTGVSLDRATAEELDYFHTYAQMESVGRRMWTQVLTADERDIFGGDFAAAYRDGRTLGMFNRLYPGLSYERAMLELLLQLGAMHYGIYRRLLRQISENDYLPPSRGARPHWDGRELGYNGEVVRRVARPRQAKRITAILDAFQRNGWPHRLTVEKLGKVSAKQLSDALDQLREGLTRIAVAMDGSGTGITWRPI